MTLREIARSNGSMSLTSLMLGCSALAGCAGATAQQENQTAKTQVPIQKEDAAADETPEGLFNEGQFMLISDTAPNAWYYDNERDHRFDEVTVENGVYVCRRAIARIIIQNSGEAIAIKDLTRSEIYLVFVKTQWNAAVTEQTEKQRVFDQGEKALAQIVNIRDTGVTINGAPQVGLELLIKPAGRPPCQVKTESVVPVIHLPRIQPGMTVAVRIDRSSPMSVLLDLDTPVVQPKPVESVNCGYCHKPYQKGLHACPHCGAPRESM